MIRWDRFTAEILFLNPDQAPRGIEALAAAGCEFEYQPDAIDDYSPTVFGTVTGITELDEDELGDWLMRIIDPHSGDVWEWGLDSLVEARKRESEARKRIMRGH